MVFDDNPQIKVKCIEFIDKGNADVPFIRNYIYDECGELQNVVDVDYDGTTYNVVGPIDKPNSVTTNNILDVTAIETITTLVDNNDGTYTYTNEAGNPVNITTGFASVVTNVQGTGKIIATHDDGAGNTVDIRETTTSLTLVGNILTFTDEEGNTFPYDLSIYIDDTNLARLISGTVNAAGIATFTRDDATNFTVDFSQFFDDTNLARMNSGSIAGTDLIMTRDDATNFTVDLSAFALANHTHSMLHTPNGVNEVVTVTAGQNVGIGTTSPNCKLEIEGSGANQVCIVSTDPNPTATAGIRFQAINAAGTGNDFASFGVSQQKISISGLSSYVNDPHLSVTNQGDVILEVYDSARDDGPVDNTRVLYVDANGEVKVGTIDAASLAALNAHIADQSNPHNTMVNDTIVAETDPDVIINNKNLIIQENGDPVITFNRDDAVGSTPDIHFSQNGLISAESSLHFMIDSDNDDTNRAFFFRANSPGTTGADILFRIAETGDVRMDDYTTARDDGTVDNTRVAYFSANGTVQVGTLPAAPAETITTLVDNNDGTATYTNEANAPVTIPLGLTKEYWHGVGGAVQTLANATITTTNIIEDFTSNAATFTIAANVVTVNKAGNYKIEYTGTSDTADGGRRGMLFDLYINGTKQNAEGFTYSRNNATGENSASNRKIVTLAANDTVELRMNRNSGGSVQTVPTGISLTIEEK